MATESFNVGPAATLPDSFITSATVHAEEVGPNPTSIIGAARSGSFVKK